MRHICALTVLMDPTVCSTTVPASAYAACPRLEILAIVIDKAATAMTIGGIPDSVTSARRQPVVNATIKPPKKVASSCKNFPTCN